MITTFGRKNPWPKCICIAEVKGPAGVSWGQPKVKLLRNALWLPNLVGRTLDQSVMYCWDQRSCRGQLGHPEVKLLRNAICLPNFVGRTTDQSEMYCWGQRSCRGQLGQPEVKLLRNVLWLPNLVGRTPELIFFPQTGKMIPNCDKRVSQKWR